MSWSTMAKTCEVASSTMTHPPVVISRRPWSKSFRTCFFFVGWTLQQYNQQGSERMTELIQTIYWCSGYVILAILDILITDLRKEQDPFSTVQTNITTSPTSVWVNCANSSQFCHLQLPENLVERWFDWNTCLSWKKGPNPLDPLAFTLVLPLIVRWPRHQGLRKLTPSVSWSLGIGLPSARSLKGVESEWKWEGKRKNR